MTEAAPALLTVSEVFEPGTWSGDICDHVTLDYDGRHRRRIVLTGDHGTRFLLDLARSRLLAGGSALKLSDGRLVEVIAESEPLLEIGASDSADLLRLAWHIGNRHLAAQIGDDRIFIRRDHVVEDMLRGLGASVRHVKAAFNPEGGAYGNAHQGHSHNDHEPHASHGHEH